MRAWIRCTRRQPGRRPVWSPHLSGTNGDEVHKTARGAGRATRSPPSSRSGAARRPAGPRRCHLDKGADAGAHPIRRMLGSPLEAFFRGAASMMAGDLAATPRSGLNAQLCGDAHAEVTELIAIAAELRARCFARAAWRSWPPSSFAEAIRTPRLVSSLQQTPIAPSGPPVHRARACPARSTHRRGEGLPRASAV